MKIIVTGPRSVGKSTITKILSKELNCPRYSSDEIIDKHLKKHGGLDFLIEIGKAEFVLREATLLLNKVLKKKDFVLDLSGGSWTSEKYKKRSEELKNLVKNSDATIIGLLPSKNSKDSIKFLFEREKKRTHFLEMDKNALSEKVRSSYIKYPKIFSEFCDEIIYVMGKTVEEIVNEIKTRLK